MCGIAGLMSLGTQKFAQPARDIAARMADSLAHRGPDGQGEWGDTNIGLGHRRLAVIDLTEAGAQPMFSGNGRYVIVYNGEVYNFQDLRREFETRGHVFRGCSDTEIILEACVALGPEAAAGRLLGMFAFAFYDRQSGVMTLARDRFGVKPLYWSIQDGVFLFGSELRALMAYPSFRKEINPDAIAAVLRRSYVPTPDCVFRGAHKLAPGSLLTIKAGRAPVITVYWSLDEVANRAPQDCSPDEAVDRLDGLLRDAVRRRLIADVPVGAFLSGGVDSSLVVALMQAVSDRPARTFTVGFGESAFDESVYARDIARRLGTDHSEIVLDAHAVLDLVANVANWFDEPFADSSQLPTYLVARATRQSVTVALSGDGGDELFAGYPKYRMLENIWRYAGPMPHSLRAAAAKFLAKAGEPLLKTAAGLVIDSARGERIGEKARRLAKALAARDADKAAVALTQVGISDMALVLGAGAANDFMRFSDTRNRPLPARMQIHDMQTYLTDDILTKVDRCTMAVALEAREPLLDHRLAEFVWSLPDHVRVGSGRPKDLLRRVLARYLPDELFDRPKRGFSIPLDLWLTGPLREWAENLLSSQSLSEHGIFDASRVRYIWQQHLSGRRREATGIWNILMVQAWAARWL